MSGENRRLGCFRLLDEVGKGSQGVVYKAICESDGFEGVSVGTVVAIRVLSVDPGDKDYEVRLGKRITELKALSHPAVARSLGSFCEKGPFGDMRVLVQEWFEGESLGAWLRRNPNGLDADMALRIGGQLLDALAYISSKGVVLGSVQPNHVVLCKDGSVKLAAFEYPVQQKPCMPTVCPPLNYTAPEFLNAEFRGDERSDIFSFGVCFHEMLTGRLPYAAQSHTPTIAEFFERWHGGDNAPIMIHPSVKRIMIGASESLEKALRGKREERYATFADFAAAFKGIRCRELTHGGVMWRLLQYVGRGGFSEVFKARDVKTGQVVAIKHLLNCQYMDRFNREARVLSQLKDSSIVRFISFFEKEMDGCGKCAFLVMEYLDGMPGKTLRDELRRASGKSIRRDLVIRAFVNYAHGLSVMHAKGFVHRDIKPGKLYFPTDAIDRALIMSSTIVRDMSGTMTAGAVPGTLDYMPPEVAVTEDRGSPAMDVFALGLSLYEALSGKMAYSRLPTGTEGLLAFVKRAKEKTRPDLDESSYSDLSDLVRLVREMTEPDVTKRLKDAAEVERRLCILAGVEAVNSIPFDEDADYGLEGFEGRRQNQRKEVVEFVNAMFQKRKRRNLLKNSLLIVAAVAKVFYRWRHPSKGATGTSSEIHDSVTTRMEVSLVTESEDRADVASEILNPDGKTIIDGFHVGRAPLSPAGSRNNVFKAECVEEGRLGLRKGEVVALKFVEETPSSPSFEEFEKAVAYLREIKSPHAPRYYGCFRVERWINGTLKRFRMTVMEYLDGADLGYRVKVRSPNFYADEIMYVLDQLLKGLCELAEAGVIHRDIKPSNIFICRDGTVKLIDFDTALIRGIDLCPKNRKIVGTPEFAAPDYLTEGFRGDEISDVFSVGMTLYYMVHGVSPHRAKRTLSGRMDEQCFSSFWRTREPDSSKTWWIMERESFCRGPVPLLGLPQVFSKALALDRNRRFTSFEDFRRSLQIVEFVRVRHGKKGYVRVVSGWECISGAGVGYSCVYGRSERGELRNWGIEGLRLVQPEQMEEKERSALLKIFHGWCNCSEPSFWFGGVHEGCVDIRDLFSSCSRTPLVMTEKFAAENVKVVQTSFDKIKSIEERRKEVEEHERAMDLS